MLLLLCLIFVAFIILAIEFQFFLLDLYVFFIITYFSDNDLNVKVDDSASDRWRAAMLHLHGFQ